MNNLFFKNSTSLRFVFLSWIFVLFSFDSLARGAVCVYQDSDGVVHCVTGLSSGIPDESACASWARASNPTFGMNAAAINTAAGSCASNWSSPGNTCLDTIPPHNVITSATSQTACEAAGGRWCLQTYYIFFLVFSVV
jgi:hypothetical protein